MRTGLVAVVCAIGCGSSSDREPQPSPPSPPSPSPAPGDAVVQAPVSSPDSRMPLPKLPDDVRLRTTWWLNGAKANVQRRCLRAPVHGAVAVGPADADMLALAEPTGAEAACLGISASALRDAVMRCDTNGCTSRAFDDVPPPPQLFEGLAEKCAPVLARIDRAIAHEDACSPYLVGRKRETSSPKIIAVAHVVAIEARRRAREGAAGDAIDKLLAVAQVSQDFARGGTSAIMAAWSGAAQRTAVENALEILGAGLPIDDAALAKLAGEVDMLIAAAPGVGETLEGERLAMPLTMSFPRLYGDSFKPLGGYPDDVSPAAAPATGNDAGGITEAWTAMDDVDARAAAACPATATLKACFHALRALVVELDVPAKSSATLAGRLAALRATAAPNTITMAHQVARPLLALLTLRIALELRRNACDPMRVPNELTWPAWLGDPLVLAGDGKGGFTVRVASWLADDRELPAIRCKR